MGQIVKTNCEEIVWLSSSLNIAAGRHMQCNGPKCEQMLRAQENSDQGG
jgi:hypothetical protein